MATRVSASCSVNILSPLAAKKSGALRFAIESTALDIGYSEYRNQDYRLGVTKEILNSYRVGEVQQAHVNFHNLAGDGIESPLDDFNDPNLKYNYQATDVYNLEFMPMVEVKSDYHPNGILELDDHNPKKIRAKEIAKAMNVDLEEMTETFLGTANFPPIGSPEWLKYNKAWRASGSTLTEGQYREKLKEDEKEKKKGMKDVTDIAIGYFGTFNEEANVMPQAMFYTYLDCLKRTGRITPSSPGQPGVPQVGQPGDPNYQPGVPPTPSAPMGSGRKFQLEGELYEAVYSLNGYIHRIMPGLVPGNTKKRRGYSKAEVHLDSDKPLDHQGGRILHTDFASDAPYLDKTDWNANGSSTGNTIPDMYVSIKVQLNAFEYEELIMVDLYQQTTIEGKGYTRASNSGNQSKQQKEMTWTEAYIAESFIPLTKRSMEKVRLFDRANLLIESKCYFIQAVNVYKEKWYETKFFRALLVVVAVVIAVVSLGSATSLSGALISLATQMAIGFAISKIIEVLVDMGIISARFAMIAMSVVAVYMVGSGLYTGNIDFTLMSNVMKLTEATGKVIQYEMIKEQEEYKAKMAELKEKEDKLKEEEEDLKDLHLSSEIGRLITDLKRFYDPVEEPLMESRDEFLMRTTSMDLQTELLDINGLTARLPTIKDIKV